MQETLGNHEISGGANHKALVDALARLGTHTIVSSVCRLGRRWQSLSPAMQATTTIIRLGGGDDQHHSSNLLSMFKDQHHAHTSNRSPLRFEDVGLKTVFGC